jgi:hypothetical protein
MSEDNSEYTTCQSHMNISQWYIMIYYVCCPQCNVYQLVKLASQHFVVDVHDVTNQLKYIMLLKVLILKY